MGAGQRRNGDAERAHALCGRRPRGWYSSARTLSGAHSALVGVGLAVVGRGAHRFPPAGKSSDGEALRAKSRAPEVALLAKAGLGDAARKLITSAVSTTRTKERYESGASAASAALPANAAQSRKSSGASAPGPRLRRRSPRSNSSSEILPEVSRSKSWNIARALEQRWLSLSRRVARRMAADATSEPPRVFRDVAAAGKGANAGLCSAVHGASSAESTRGGSASGGGGGAGESPFASGSKKPGSGVTHGACAGSGAFARSGTRVSENIFCSSRYAAVPSRLRSIDAKSASAAFGAIGTSSRRSPCRNISRETHPCRCGSKARTASVARSPRWSSFSSRRRRAECSSAGAAADAAPRGWYAEVGRGGSASFEEGGDCCGDGEGEGEEAYAAEEGRAPRARPGRRPSGGLSGESASSLLRNAVAAS
mmetsp:Transcript_12510/g.41243  ORF Transcript_12510/g.41243 Transcript_12510/m.41243 type:complete len:425 (+) Transcript_12510:1145-2419(+)